jgi:hypothetical protein
LVEKGRFIKGAGATVLVVLAVTYALYGFAVMGFATVWSTVLFFAVVFAGALAAPRALRLMKEGLLGLGGAAPAHRILPSERDEGDVSRATDPGASSPELRVLEAIEQRGKLTPAQAALETGLTVAETDHLLSGLAQRGHLDVHAEGGKLFYNL